MLKKVNNNHLYILIGIVFILNTILFNTINSSKAQWTGPSGTPGEDTVNILTSPMQSNLDVAGYDIKDVGSINTSGNINIKRDDGAYAALLIGHTGNVEAVTYFDAINGDFAGEDYGRIGQNNDGYMEYRLNPNSPDLSHKFFLGTTNVLNITEGRLESSGTICDGSGNCLGSSSFSGDSNFTDNITVNNTIQSGSGPLNVSANGWGMNFLIDTDGGSADWFTWKDNGVELMNLEGNTGNLTVSGVLNANSGIKVDGNTVIDGDGNIIGADSNADSLDGIDSGSFLRSDISDSYNGGTLRVQNSVGQDVTQSSSINGLQVFQSSAGSDALMSFHVGGDYALHFGLDGETNDLTVGGWSMGNNKYKVWHAGNDGSESGLDADAVDGLDVHTGRNHNANKIVRTDQHGYLQAGWINTPSGFASGNWNKIYASEDDYVRYITKDTLCNAVTGHGCGYDNTIANTDYCSGGNCGGNINVPAGDSYNKYCMWGSADSTYCIGMYSGQNFGGLNNNYAMTFTMNNEDSRGWLWRDNAHNSSQGAMSLTTSGNLTVAGDVSASNFFYSSDQRLKKNIKTITNPLEKIIQLEGVSFNWKKDNKESIGLIAQDVEKIFPELVFTNEQGLKSIAYANLIAPLIEAIKIQDIKIEDQEEKLSIQDIKIEQLIKEIEKLK